MSSEFKLPLPARLLRCTAPRRPVPAIDDQLVGAHLGTFAELEAGEALELEGPVSELGPLELLVEELVEELEQRPTAELSISLTLLDESSDVREAEVAEVA